MIFRLFLTAVALGALLAADHANAQQRSKPEPSKKIRPAQGVTRAAAGPQTPNPSLSLLPEGVTPDWGYWRSQMKSEARARKALRAPARATLPPLDEAEPNDTAGEATAIDFFSTLQDGSASVTLSGSFDFAGAPNPVSFTTGDEDNGSISLATATGLSAGTPWVTTDSFLGDGPYGSTGTGTGDFDFFSIANLTAGDVIIVDITTPSGGFDLAGLDSHVAIWNAAGQRLMTNEDDFRASQFDSYLVYGVPAAGTYYVSVGSFFSEYPVSPFDSSSGLGVWSEGAYTLTLGLFGTTNAAASEDDGSITSGYTVALTESNYVVEYAGTLGDGPHGSSGSGSGDFDFFCIPNLKEGQLLTADINTQTGGLSGLDGFLTLWDSAGNVLATNDDDLITYDSFIGFPIPADGTYYVSVGSWTSENPTNPFDSSTGPGVGTEGDYRLVLELSYFDPDFYQMTLRGGDVLGSSLDMLGGGMELRDANGDLLVNSTTDASAAYPLASPLPGGSAGPSFGYVIPSTGTYYVRLVAVDGGAYTADVVIHRPGLELAEEGAKQILFVDFDGATVDTNLFIAPFGGVADLSPLSAFLSGWGLAPTDEDAVIDAILANLQENLDTDLRSPGGNNPNFDLEIRNSRDHADPWGQPNVSRLIIGGTIAESGIPTIGIAESIDIGNFETAETALVLLDLLSNPDSADPNSLNSFGRTGSVIDIIAEGVGNITAHEAGHYLGSFHTEQFVTEPNIMDQGGNLPNSVGVGPDGIFGTVDDIDVDFGVDEYVGNEGFVGTEDTLNTTAFGLSTPFTVTDIYVDFGAAEDGVGSVESPFKFLNSALGAAPTGVTVRFMPGATSEVATVETPLIFLNENPGAGSVAIGATP